MQLLEADARLKFPREVVFAAYRDHMADVVEYLPNIRKMDVQSRVEDGGVVELVNVWHGGGDIPSAARIVLSDKMLNWTDYARWTEEDFTCSWRIETHSFKEAVNCTGTTRFFEVDEGTRLEIRGKIEIDVSQISGVPKLMRKNVSRKVSEFLSKKITPNLLGVSDALSTYLERHPS